MASIFYTFRPILMKFGTNVQNNILTHKSCVRIVGLEGGVNEIHTSRKLLNEVSPSFHIYCLLWLKIDFKRSAQNTVE